MTTSPSSRLPILRAAAAPTAAADPASLRWKPSRYNVFRERGDFVWAFNSRSTAFARMSTEQYRSAQRMLAGDLETTSPAERDLLRSLIKGQFLIREEFDELGFLKVKNRLTRFAAKGLGLIIAPTLRCNFGCEYCYVDLNANKMSAENRNRLVRFFERKLQPRSRATVCWTGGDPSLAVDVVAELSRSFLAMCRERESRYDAYMITNGYLLDDAMLDQVLAAGIGGLQITFDGDREHHDRRRFLANGAPTYDRIRTNLVRACRRIDVNIRVNVDRENHETLPNLFADLAASDLGHRASIYFAQVEAVNENCSSYHDRCLSTQEYAALEPELMREALAHGLQLNGSGLTRLHGSFCGANSQNFYVVDSNCQLLKCYNDYGTADRNGIGSIGEDGIEIIDKPHNLIKWLSWDPFESAECRDCAVLPLCMGGCSYHIMSHDMEVEGGCLKLRYTIDQVLDLYGERLSQNARGDFATGGCNAGGCAKL